MLPSEQGSHFSEDLRGGGLALLWHKYLALPTLVGGEEQDLVPPSALDQSGGLVYILDSEFTLDVNDVEAFPVPLLSIWTPCSIERVSISVLPPVFGQATVSMSIPPCPLAGPSTTPET